MDQRHTRQKDFNKVKKAIVETCWYFMASNLERAWNQGPRAWNLSYVSNHLINLLHHSWLSHIVINTSLLVYVIVFPSIAAILERSTLPNLCTLSCALRLSLTILNGITF